MTCTKCGEEIKPGNLYCSKCGMEVQIVSAYNVMEDEFFIDIHKQEMKPVSQRGATDYGMILQKKNLYFCILTAILGFLTLLVVVFLMWWNLGRAKSDPEKDNYVQFVQALADSDENKAYDCLKSGLSMGKDQLSDLFWLAWLYGEQGKQEEQIATLQQILASDKENIYACRELIRVYVEAGDFEGMYAFYDSCAGSRLSALFTDYLVEAPVIDVPFETMYDTDLLSIHAAEGLNVYYTLDGSSPVTNGTLYFAPINLLAGTYELQAVACNEKGYYSTVVSKEVTVEKRYQLGMPHVTPNSGEYLAPQMIYVNVPEGCSAYYTWNGSNPTTESSKYNGGISMPEGNNVLSVVLVDEYGNMSSVQRVNYIYMPQ